MGRNGTSARAVYALFSHFWYVGGFGDLGDPMVPTLRVVSGDVVTVPPPPPVSKTHLAQEPTPGSAVKFSHHFFYQGSGFFMFLVDVGQLFRCAGHHFMCVTTLLNVNCGKGEGTHVPAQRAGKFFFCGTGLPTAVRKNQPLVPRSNSRITFFTRVVGFSCFWWM